MVTFKESTRWSRSPPLAMSLAIWADWNVPERREDMMMATTSSPFSKRGSKASQYSWGLTWVVLGRILAWACFS